MSAYICYPSHIGLLAASYHDGDKFATPEIKSREVGRVASVLARQNIDSVIYRYPKSKDGERPGPTFIPGDGNDEAIIEFAILWAQHYCQKKVAAAPIELIKLAHTLDYQSCETPNYEQTNAFKYIQQIIYSQTRKLKGYEAAASEWSDTTNVPTIARFFEQLQENQQ